MLKVLISFICGTWFGVAVMAILSAHKYNEKGNSDNGRINRQN